MVSGQARGGAGEGRQSLVDVPTGTGVPRALYREWGSHGEHRMPGPATQYGDVKEAPSHPGVPFLYGGKAHPPLAWSPLSPWGTRSWAVAPSLLPPDPSIFSPFLPP